ncbi:MAG: hypothetical protein IPL60_09525 [Ardenticatenia bacterium]|nr:hypothetical protein [Ardenticatenia bacterium]
MDSEVGKTRGQGRSLLAVPFNTVPTILRTPDYFLVLMYIQRNDVSVLEEVRRRVSLIEEFERVSEGIARSVGSTLDMKTMRDTGVFSVIEELERDRHELSNLQMYLHLQPVLPKGWDERLREGVGSVWRSIEQLQTSGDIGGEISSAIHRLEKEMASLLQGIQAETAPLAQLPVQEDSSVLSWLPLFVRFHSDALEKKRRELYDTWTQQRSKVNDSEAREQISSMLVVARRVGSRSEQRLLWCVVLLTYRLYGPAIAIAQRQIAAEPSQEDCQFRCVLGYAQTMTESIEGRRKAAKTLRDARSKYSTSPLPCHLLAFCIGTSHEKKLGAEFRLGEAIDLERETLKLAGSDYEIEGSAKNNLAYYLSQLAMETRDHEPVSEAVEVAKQLSAFMENYHVVRPEWLHTIGFTYYVASQFAGSEAERRQYRRDAKTELIRIDLLPNVTAVCKAVAGELLSSLE